MAEDTHANQTTAFRYDGALAQDIEARRQQRWEEEKVHHVPNPGEPGFDPNQKKFYCLDMFPYPSGKGLHVGHPLGYIGTDIICRFRRMNGEAVLHPMGWDAFGLPAEQYAIQTGVHPATTTRTAIDTYRRQLKSFGFSYDWSREVATIDSNYYRWTQWIWLQAYESFCDPRTDKATPINVLEDALAAGDLTTDGKIVGTPESLPTGIDWQTLDRSAQRQVVDNQRLAYLSEQVVNWCPALGTALANEEVIDGKSERGGHPVVRKPLKQWMFRITSFADRLANDLDTLDWPHSTKVQQREWIGRSEGAAIRFEVDGHPDQTLEVFTTRPDTLFGATFLVVAPEHPLVQRTDNPEVQAYCEAAANRSERERQADDQDKTGVALGLHGIHPVSGALVPIWVADYVLMGYGTGAIMAVPGHDDRDHAFASKFDIEITTVVAPEDGSETEGCFTEHGLAINSACEALSLDGLRTAEAKTKMIDWLVEHHCGERRVTYRLRDWLFSRQRYWGEPFPVVFDPEGNCHPVTNAGLPVELPDLADYEPAVSDEPQPLLAKATDWVHTTAGAAGVSPKRLPPETPVTRETNTMPGWAGSCWYWIRYCDPHNEQAFISEEAKAFWLSGGVDLYVGGAEHATLHLLYARFWHKILFDLGHLPTSEPFQKLFHQGLLTAFAFQRDNGQLVPTDEVDETSEDTFLAKDTGEPVRRIVAKMSKSLRNVVNPDDVIAEFGADTFRLYEMYMGPLDASKPWNTRDIVGVFRFLQRAWRLLIHEATGEPKLRSEKHDAIEQQLHRTIAKVGDDIERLANNTAIAALIEFVNFAGKTSGDRPALTASQADQFARLLGPFAPHIAEELRERCGTPGCIIQATWPTYDETLLKDETIELPVQVAGKMKGKVAMPVDADEAVVKELVLADEKILAALEGRSIRKLILVPGRIVNLIPGD